MMGKPMKTLELSYPIIQFLIIFDNQHLFSSESSPQLVEFNSQEKLQVTIKF